MRPSSTNSTDLARLAREILGPNREVGAIVETPPRAAELVPIPSSLHPRLIERLESQGIDRLFTHQAEAVLAAQSGAHVLVTTGTNSGKSLCYHLPVLDTLLREPSAHALYLFPTKALGQDQMARLEQLIPDATMIAGVYDGDTARGQRSMLRRSGNIVFSNPEMLHLGLLPNNESWGRFWRSLRYVVLDEVHVYSGIFGSHVANVIRRLLRICRWYGARPQLIGTSATLGDPLESFRLLTGQTPLVIDRDASAQGSRLLALLPPSEASPSPNRDAGRLLAELAIRGERALCFCRSRAGTERVLIHARDVLAEQGHDVRIVDAYRGGYTPAERRKLEARLRKGDLRGLATTNALELGIDVGDLSSVIINGYPGTLASFWQQAARAGRGTSEGLTLFLAHDDPLEYHLVHEPENLVDPSRAGIHLHPGNSQILAAHLRCAAYERPIAEDEWSWFPEEALEIAATADLQFSRDRWFYPSHEHPASKVDLRGSLGPKFDLIVDGATIGHMESWRAQTHALPGSIYLHRGETFLVDRLSFGDRRIELEPIDADWTTGTTVQSVVETSVPIRDRAFGPHRLFLAGIRVTSTVTALHRQMPDGSQEPIPIDVQPPPRVLETLAVRWEVAGEFDPEDERAAAAVHALEHALRAAAPLVGRCAPQDLGSAWYACWPDSMTPAVLVYDDVPGGVGIAELLFEGAEQWWTQAQQIVTGCDCLDGCPRCLYWANCELRNDFLSKSGILNIFAG